ncbi:MAG: methyltransferase domain-containing protein [Acidobacteriota bacterium]
MQPDPRRRRIKVNKGLRFYHEILGLDHLQYGLWDGEPQTLDGLKSAQERYARTLESWIPEGVENILDVGCGTGALAERLTGNGFNVEGLSPDPYQQQLVTSRASIPFYLTRLQDFEPNHPYDLAIMSESAQYIWLEYFFENAVKVAKGGHLLIADYFIKDESADLAEKSGHPLSDFLAEGERHGFELLRREDVTDQVVPTLDLAHHFADRYALPSLGMLDEILSQDYPRLYRLGRRLFRKRIERELDKIRFIVDGEQFRRAKRYLFLLYRVPA